MKERSVFSRIEFKAQIKALSPIHVGSGGGDETTDLALIKDGQGRFLIPGTGLTGAIREALGISCWLGQESNSTANKTGSEVHIQRSELEADSSLFGSHDPESGRASQILIEDAEVKDVIPIIRQGVGINRYTGAAADGVKHDRAVLPAGSTFELRIAAEPYDSKESVRVQNLLSRLKHHLSKGDIRIGGGKSRGLGQIGLSDPTESQPNCSMTETLVSDVVSFLRGSGPNELAFPTDIEIPQRKSLRLAIKWKPVGPLMVKAERHGVDTDMLPYMEETDGKVHLSLPGSGIKGAFRSRAELIVRTVKTTKTFSQDDFLDQVKVCIVSQLFGSAPSQKGKKDGAISAAFVHDSKSLHEVSKEIVREVNLASSHGKQVGEGKLNKRTHNSIDRWTGGTADGALYSVCEPWGIEWEPIVFDVDWGRLEEQGQLKNSLWLICALLLQAYQGWIPLGFGANRGLGDWEITGLTIEGWPEGFGDPPTFREGQGIVIPDETKKKLAYTSEEAGQ